MIKHIVLLSFKSATTPQQVSQCLQAAQKALTPIPGVRNLFTGKAVLVRGTPKYQCAILMDFSDEAALKAYREHPEHVKFATEVLRPLVEETLVLDYN